MLLLSHYQLLRVTMLLLSQRTFLGMMARHFLIILKLLILSHQITKKVSICLYREYAVLTIHSEVSRDRLSQVKFLSVMKSQHFQVMKKQRLRRFLLLTETAKLQRLVNLLQLHLIRKLMYQEVVY